MMKLNGHDCKARLPWRLRLAAYFVITALVAFCYLAARSSSPHYDQRIECLDFYGRPTYAKRQVQVSRDGFVFLVTSRDEKVNDVIVGDCDVTSDH